MNGREFIASLLALPSAPESSKGTLMTSIRKLTGNVYWDDLFQELTGKELVTAYLFKRVADDVFFNFAQDASLSLDAQLDGRELLFHVDDIFVPLVIFARQALSNSPGADTYLHVAIEKYFALLRRLATEGRALLAQGGH